jgi:hypothetical protein
MYSRSILHGSWFCRSNLALLEVMFLTYDMIHRVMAYATYLEYQQRHTPITNWTHFCREAMLEYVETSSHTLWAE